VLVRVAMEDIGRKELADLRAQGVRISLRGGRLVGGPREKLTPVIRGRVQAHYQGLRLALVNEWGVA
jgi:hypothetical protein